MDPSARGKVYRLGEWTNADIADPYQKDIAADLTRKTNQYYALENAKKKLVDRLNNEHREIWNDRLEVNNSLQIGDQVCTYDNKYGNVEQIGADQDLIIRIYRDDGDLIGSLNAEGVNQLLGE